MSGNEENVVEEQKTPELLLSFKNDAGDLVFAIHQNGSVERGEGYTSLDDTALIYANKVYENFINNAIKDPNATILLASIIMKSVQNAAKQ